MTPTEWFDQFSVEPGEEWPADAQWCARHWGPCPQLGANGIGATLALIQIFMEEIVTPEATTAAAMQAQLFGAGHLCCTLGDERMYELWGHWPPVVDP